MVRRRRAREQLRKPKIVAPKLGPELSQYGDDRWGFRDEPRWDRESEISMLGGRLDPVQAYRAIGGRPPRDEWNPRVRHFAVERLVAGEFTVKATPTARIPGHASVSAPTEVETAQGWWAEVGRGRLIALVACVHAIRDQEVSACAL